MTGDETRTSLRADIAVDKRDIRIARRGALDGLLAKAVLNCAYAEHFGYTNITMGTRDLVRVMRELVHADAVDKEPDVKTILGMTLDEIRDVSQHPREELGLDHYFPDENCDLMTAYLNVLRTDIRTAELMFCGEDDSGVTRRIQFLLNRLSSAAYILMLECRSERV